MTKIAALLALLAIVTTLSLAPQMAFATPAQPDRIDALRQKVEHLREQRSALRERVAVMTGAWWRLDRAIFYMGNTLGMELPSEVLDAREQSWEEAMGALPQL